MDSKLDIFIFAGEPSGDLLGGDLIKTLLEKNPSLSITGVTGREMKSYPVKTLLDIEAFSVMGFIDVFKSLPRLISHFYSIKNFILKNSPEYVILIDYPGFNLRLAKSLKKAQCQSKIIHYVCPSVWAWKKNRLKSLKKYVDHIFTLFPFETFYLETHQIAHSCVGHPLTKIIPKNDKKSRENLILIFPGSRKQEIKRNFPLQIQACIPFKDQFKIGISYMHEQDKEWMSSHLETTDQAFFFFDQSEKYQYMQKGKVAIATSGTITLELALSNLPTIVTYKLSNFDAFLAKKIFDIELPFYCIVNFICLKEIFPELYSSCLTKQMIEHSLEKLLSNNDLLEKISNETSLVRELIEKKEIELPNFTF